LDRAQYDVFPNPGERSRAALPCVVGVQSRLLSELRTRLVIPLARHAGDLSERPGRLAPRFLGDGEAVVAQSCLAAPIEARLLKQPVASRADRALELRDALDAVCGGV
jgi:toxin CcdB